MATVGYDSCQHLLHKIQIMTRGTLCKLQYERTQMFDIILP